MLVTTEVLMYVQSVRIYFDNNPEVKKYFIGTSDEEVFFEKLGELSQKNTDNEEDVMLTQEQFESLRQINSNVKSLFINVGEYGQVCLN